MSPALAFPLPLHTRSWFPWEVAGSGASGQQYTLDADFVFISARWGRITVPAGFVTDLASIPRAAWRYIAPTDPCIEMPSVVHDFLYAHQGDIGLTPALTREECDDVLIEAMTLCGARWDQRAAVKAAVNLFGGSHWKANS